jgi:DNA-binding NtrC family response regulator
MLFPGDLSGLDLVEQMQAEKPGLPAIISSGYNPEFIGLHEPTAAVFSFLRKPATIQEVTQLVGQLLPWAIAPLRLVPGGQ